MDNLKEQINNIISSSSESNLIGQLRKLIEKQEALEILESVSIKTLINSSVKQIIEGELRNSIIPTGFQNFDYQFGGLNLGELNVIAARPGMGVTQLLINLTHNISQQNSVLYFSFNLSPKALALRFVSLLSNLKLNDLKQNSYDPEELERLKNCQHKLHEHPIYINATSQKSLRDFRSICAKSVTQDGVKVIVVDYIQFISFSTYKGNRENEISLVCRELKNIAKELNVCIIARSELSRAVELRGMQNNLRLSDLKDSGAIEQIADKVMFLYRPEYYGITQDENGNDYNGLSLLIVAKNETGATGEAKLTLLNNQKGFANYKEQSKEFSFTPSQLNEFDEDPF